MGAQAPKSDEEIGELDEGGSGGVRKGRGKGLIACLAYMACSVAMVLGNKAITQISGSIEGIQVSIVLFQSVVASVMMNLQSKTRDTSDQGFSLREISWKIIPLAICFTGMLVSSLLSFQHLGVSTITVLKNLSNIMTLTGEWLWLGKIPSFLTLVCHGLMIVACLCYAQFDLEFSFVGYSFCLLNCFATSSYVLGLRRLTTTSQIPKDRIVWGINLLSVPLLGFVALARGEYSSIVPALKKGGWPFLGLNVIIAVIGGALSFVAVWTIEQSGASVYAVVGSLNKVPAIITAAFIFREPISSSKAVFLAIGIGAGILFAYDQASVGSGDLGGLCGLREQVMGLRLKRRDGMAIALFGVVLVATVGMFFSSSLMAARLSAARTLPGSAPRPQPLVRAGK